jgi:hypothetical protein
VRRDGTSLTSNELASDKRIKNSFKLIGGMGRRIQWCRPRRWAEWCPYSMDRVKVKFEKLFLAAPMGNW